MRKLLKIFGYIRIKPYICIIEIRVNTYKTMKATYNKSKIMKNAWYLKKANTSMSFSTCLRKAWRNEKLAIMTAKIENRPMEEPKVAEWHPLANVPADYYGNSRTYYGD